MTVGRAYILTQTDVERGMQALANRLLGDSTQAQSLVSANNLVPPYMTLDPSQVYGAVIASGTISIPLFQGATSVPFANAPNSINTVYLRSSSATGLTGEVAEIEYYDGLNIRFANPLSHTYLAGSQILLFSTYSVADTKVLLPGDTLFIPISPADSFTITDQAQITDAFGSDVNMLLSFANGDLATVSGLRTLVQRITIAIQTTVGSLPLHPQFGSQMRYAIGTPGTSVKWAFIISQALLKLPEISDVTNVQAVVSGDKVILSATIYANTTNTPILLQNESFTLTAV